MSKATNKPTKAIMFALTAIMILMLGTISVSAAQKHNVTFLYGTKSAVVSVKHGGNATPPADTYVPGYTFTGWVGNPNNVTEDRIILGAYATDAAAQAAAAQAAAQAQAAQAAAAQAAAQAALPSVTFYDTFNNTIIGTIKATPGQPCYMNPPTHPGWEFHHYANADGSLYSGTPTANTTVYAIYSVCPDTSQDKKDDDDDDDDDWWRYWWYWNNGWDYDYDWDWDWDDWWYYHHRLY